MHVVVEFIEARADQTATVRAALLMLARQAQGMPGCRHIDICADPLEPASFLVYRVYSDEAAAKAHADTPEYEALALTLAPWLVRRRVLAYELISEHGQA